jgi:hypothetical protein
MHVLVNFSLYIFRRTGIAWSASLFSAADTWTGKQIYSAQPAPPRLFLFSTFKGWIKCPHEICKRKSCRLDAEGRGEVLLKIKSTYHTGTKILVQITSHAVEYRNNFWMICRLSRKGEKSYILTIGKASMLASFLFLMLISCILHHLKTH